MKTLRSQIQIIIEMIGRPKDLNDIESPAYWIEDAVDDIESLIKENYVEK